jgi:F0F1-type ATP synthase assembly protein I
VWLVFFLPLLMFSFIPNLASLTAMDLHQPASMVATDMMNSVGGLAMGLTLASHLFYGAVIGVVVGALTQWKKIL